MGRAIARIAGRQHGVITSAQLRELGVSSSGINRRVHSGHLHRAYPAVYRVGHRAPDVTAKYVEKLLAWRIPPD